MSGLEGLAEHRRLRPGDRADAEGTEVVRRPRSAASCRGRRGPPAIAAMGLTRWNAHVWWLPLRLVGMPLARIREVVDMPAALAAVDRSRPIGCQVEADTSTASQNGLRPRPTD